MVSTFSDVVYESSRAFADDEEEEFQNQSILSFEIEQTATGKSILEKGFSGLVFCAFVGRVAVGDKCIFLLPGFGDGFVNDKEFELLAQVFMVGQGENVVDMYQRQPRKKPVARLYLGAKDKDAPVLFALFNTHGVPRYLANEVVESVSSYIDVCSHLLIFHSDTLAYYQSDETCEGKVFYVASSKYPRTELPPSCDPLTPPNVIGGVSAAVLTRGEMTDKPVLLLAAYGETEMVDSISLQPFAHVIKQHGKLNKSTDLSKAFAQLELSLSKSSKTNINPVAISNLYI